MNTKRANLQKWIVFIVIIVFSFISKAMAYLTLPKYYMLPMGYLKVA
jgi:hypothetical protein